MLNRQKTTLIKKNNFESNHLWIECIQRYRVEWPELVVNNNCLVFVFDLLLVKDLKVAELLQPVD